MLLREVFWALRINQYVTDDPMIFAFHACGLDTSTPERHFNSPDVNSGQCTP